MSIKLQNDWLYLQYYCLFIKLLLQISDAKYSNFSILESGTPHSCPMAMAPVVRSHNALNNEAVYLLPVKPEVHWQWITFKKRLAIIFFMEIKIKKDFFTVGKLLIKMCNSEKCYTFYSKD